MARLRFGGRAKQPPRTRRPVCADWRPQVTGQGRNPNAPSRQDLDDCREDACSGIRPLYAPSIRRSITEALAKAIDLICVSVSFRSLITAPASKARHRSGREKRKNGIEIGFAILRKGAAALVRLIWPFPFAMHRMSANAHLFINYNMDSAGPIANISISSGNAKRQFRPPSSRCSMSPSSRMKSSIRPPAERSTDGCSCKKTERFTGGAIRLIPAMWAEVQRTGPI